MNPQVLLLFAALPLFGAAGIAFLKDRSALLFKNISLVIILALTVLAVYLEVYLFSSNTVLVFAQKGSIRIASINLAADRLGGMFLLAVQLLYSAMIIFLFRVRSDVFFGYKKYLLFLLLIFAVNSLILCADMFYFYISLETAVLAAYCLLMSCSRQINSLRVFKSMVQTFFASALLLLAIAFILSYISALNLADIFRQLQYRFAMHTPAGTKKLIVDFIRLLLGAGLLLKFGGLLSRSRIFFADVEAIKILRFLRVILIFALTYGSIRLFIYAFFPAVELDCKPLAVVLGGVFGVKNYVAAIMGTVL